MDALRVQGCRELSGSVEVSGAKNAALPLLFASLLVDGETRFDNVPRLADIRTTTRVLEHLGARVIREGSECIVSASKISSTQGPYELVKTMRASVLLLGPLLARFGEASVSLPGGCAIGNRPVDIHLSGLEAMGAEVSVKGGLIEAKANKLKGCKFALPFPSVGATENLVMAASLADGETILENAAQEPEIVDLCNFLISRGAKIEGAGTSRITVQGVDSLHSSESYPVMSDRIEAATYAMLGCMVPGEIEVCRVPKDSLDILWTTLEGLGAKLRWNESNLVVSGGNKLRPFQLQTAPYPGIPTDIQAQLMALALTIPGTSQIRETVFENRFMHVPELNRMGASIRVHGNLATIEGGAELSGCDVMCTDLRASAALVMAATWADGESRVHRVYHLDRGYESMEDKLRGLGVQVERFKE